jgi:osmotically-inducible protein OsmY
VIEDDNIETKVTVNLHADNEAYDKSHISVISYNGYVLLVGQVNDQILKDTATKLTRKIKGVRRIYNELEIGPPTTSLTRTSDAWITAKIKSLLLTHDNIRGTGVKVVTENGVVYLLGLVTTKEATLIANEAAGVSGVQRVVKLFEPID